MSGYLWILYDYTQPHTLMLTSTGNEHDIYIKISACVIMANWYPWYACNGIDQLRWPIFCLHWATNIVQQSIQPAASTNMVKPSHMSIWQLYRSRTKRRRMKNCIPCQAICCLPLPCDRDEYASNTTPICTTAYAKRPSNTYKDMAQHSVNAIAIHHNWQLDRAVITCNCNIEGNVVLRDKWPTLK